MDIDSLVASYAKWIKSEISIAQKGEYYEITTPYLDRYNDYMQIYVREENGLLYMTDDGYIIGNLAMAGMNVFASPQRRDKLTSITKSYGIDLRGEELTTVASLEDFPCKKHMMLQAMSAIDDMFYLNSNSVKNFFVEDIKLFLDSNNIMYSKDFSLLGKTGSIYNYDFHFQRTKYRKERFCNAINQLQESKRNLTIFNWIDTKDKRQDDSELIVIINDENSVNKKDIAAFSQYDITTVLFSERQEKIDLFSA